MATETIDVKQKSESQAEETTQPTAAPGVGSPISNEAYNVISALHSKCEGLEAYRKYSKDADGELWHELTTIEMDSVHKLVDKLEQIVKDGKLRMGEPGGAH